MTCCAGSLPAHLAAELADQSAILRVEEIKRSAKPLPNGAVMLRLTVPDVYCASCMTKIEKHLMQLEGIGTARVNLTLRQLTVTAQHLDQLAGVVRGLDELGYRSHVASEDLTSNDELKGLLRATAVAGFAAMNIMLLSVSIWNGAEAATRDLFHFVSGLIALPAVAYAGQPFFKSAFQALRHRRTNMDVPISLGVILASGMSIYESALGGGHAYFDAATSLLFFLLIGRTLDVMMRGRARQLVMQMSKLSARGAMRLASDGALHYLASDQIQPGMILHISAGERFPVDARVTQGTSSVDRSLVSGESQPVSVQEGSVLEAGTLNLVGPLEVEALKTAEQSFLGEVLQMLSAAERGKGRYVRLADRMARIYAPAVHILSMLTFIIWMVLTSGAWHQALTVAVAVLIITCPCALGLAVPVAHVVAASRLFRAGILVKEGGALERLAEIDHAAFDKTGTLSTGALRIEVCPLPEGRLSDLAKSLAQQSRHPAAMALAKHLNKAKSIVVGTAQELPGFGVSAVVKGKAYRLGRASWVSEITATPTQYSGLAFAEAGGRLFEITTGETLRSGAKATVQALAERGIAAEILSGDSPPAVALLAGKLGIARFSANLMPAQKLERLHKLTAEGHKVLMVGDGLNDAPALSAAHASMAPASASDIGRTAADFVFMGESLKAVVEAHDVSRKAARIVKQNIALAVVYNAFAVPLAMTGHLNPFIAAIAMSSSSLLVIGNSLRLKGRIHTRDVSADNAQITTKEAIA